MKTMIWVDSSFVIEWLLGTESAATADLSGRALSILPQQYVEVLCYFLKSTADLSPVVEQLEYLTLSAPEKQDLVQASHLYLAARRKKSKASLGDAILAAAAIRSGGTLLSFDLDFRHLGFIEERPSVWKHT